MARISALVIVPPVLFAAMAGLFLGGMFNDRGSELPSTLIGEQVPPLPLTGLPGQELLTDADLRAGEVTLVNFWASWCPPCRQEHPVLAELAAQGVRVAGIDKDDTTPDALDYLARYGDPYFAGATDPNGRVSIDWGVTGQPETFLIDGEGKVLARIAGPLLGTSYEKHFLPALEEALGRDLTPEG